MSIRTVLPAILLLTCAACGGPPAQDPAKSMADRGPAAYLKPAAILTAQMGGDGGFRIEGVARPGARVRLYQADGSGLSALTDAQGHWTVTIPAATAVRLFAQDMSSGARTIAGEGLLMLAPDGRAALLRAASASQVLTPISSTPRILSVDFDSDGGAVIGGLAPPGSGMNIRVDRAASGDVTADANGRFVAPIRELSQGQHLIDISGDGGGDQIVVNATRPAPLADGPFRAERLDRAWRIDWRTPAGGVQTSLVVIRVETGA